MSVAAAAPATATTAVTTTAAGATTTAAAIAAATAGAATATTAVAATTAASATATAKAATAGAATATAEATTTTTGAATAATEATRTLFAWTGLVDHQRTTVEGLTVHSVDAGLCLGVTAHLHEAEALGAAGVSIHHDLGGRDGTELCERLLKIFVAYAVRKVTDVKFIAHG